MAPPWVNLDVVPALGRPVTVAAAVAETGTLRGRARQASERVAAAQATHDEREREDVQAAAQRARAGEALGAPPVAVKKAREQLENAKREEAVRQLALTLAEHDLADALSANAGPWLEALDEEAAQARARGEKALAQFEDALAELSAATSAALWVRSGSSDGRWDRRPSATTAGAVAPSSARMTLNSAPLDRGALLGYCRELVEPGAAVDVAPPVATTAA
jgi:hypothetical protein